MKTLQNQFESFYKQTLISTIVMLAEKIRGRGTLSNLLQYRYENMIKLDIVDLEKIRDGHLKAYNEKISINQ